jgi:GNAT superfamily N-acetyltransferase
MPTASSAAARQNAAATTPHLGRIIIRRLQASDSMEVLTRVLHRAYAGQVAMGLRPLAGRQDVETTTKRCTSGECYVAVSIEGGEGGSDAAPARERLIGTILFHEVEDAKGPPWFARSDVDSFSQFAVDPDFQGCGAGRMLLDMVERRAAECGACELGLSMAEPDTALMQFYLRRGYRLIEHWVWPYTNYRSAILSKTLRQ